MKKGNPTKEETMKYIVERYELLTDEKKRAFDEWIEIHK